MTRERLLVLGGNAAGMSAASQARRGASPDQLEIVAFERGSFSSYSTCGLPYLVADQVDDAAELVARTPAQHLANGIDLRLRHEVVAIDLAKRAVRVRDLDTRTERAEPFDQLVFALGARPIRPDLPGIDAAGIHGIQTMSDGLALREDAREKGHAATGRGRAVVVVGAGYIGLEMAEALHHRGMSVTVVERSAQPMHTLDPDMGAVVANAMKGIGIDVRTATTVEGFEADDAGRVRAVVTEHGSLPTDLVVLGLGVRPDVELARAAGIRIGTAGGIATDARMATSADGVWAAGDCVEVFHRVSRRSTTVALGTHANKQGRVVGTNVTGGNATFAGVLGTAITKICAYEVGRTGLTEREATEAGLDHVAATIDSTTRAHYYPGAEEITVKVVAERGSGRLLGAQIIGKEGAAKRIDVMAAAIWNEMTADEYTQVDLGYAPPFSPLWDPTLIAARKAAAAR